MTVQPIGAQDLAYARPVTMVFGPEGTPVGLRDRLAEDSQPFDAVLGVAACRDSLGFADLLWAPLDFDAFRGRLIAGRDPGAMFETASRVVVVEEHGGAASPLPRSRSELCKHPT